MTEDMRERRAESRWMCADLVQVCWQGQEGRPNNGAAVLEDISPSGACLHFECPVPVGSVLQIEHEKGELQGTVRYCEYQEIGYFVGVSFTPSQGWSRDNFVPAHLLEFDHTLGARGRRRA